MLFVFSESDRIANICIVLSGALEREVSVSLTTVNNAGSLLATPVVDYEPLSANITFQQEGIECRTFDVVEDSVFESNESITLNLESNDLAVNISLARSEVILIDSNRKHCGSLNINH